MTQVAREEDEREDSDADERVRRDFAQDVAGENPHARPVKARIAWEACCEAEIGAAPRHFCMWGTKATVAGVLESVSGLRLGCGERLDHRGSRRTLYGLRLASPSRGGRRRLSHISRDAFTRL